MVLLIAGAAVSTSTVATAQDDGTPDPSSGHGLDVLPCTSPSEPANFRFYSVGPVFDGLIPTSVGRECEAPHPGEPVRLNVVSYIYGDCDPAPDEMGGGSGCQPPLEIQSWPACERSAADYQVVTGVPYPFVDLGELRGVPARSFDSGARVELYSGATTIVIFGSDAKRVLAAVAKLQQEPQSAPPSFPLPSTQSLLAPDLAEPAPGALPGKLTCAAQAAYAESATDSPATTPAEPPPAMGDPEGSTASPVDDPGLARSTGTEAFDGDAATDVPLPATTASARAEPTDFPDPSGMYSHGGGSCDGNRRGVVGAVFWGFARVPGLSRFEAVDQAMRDEGWEKRVDGTQHLTAGPPGARTCRRADTGAVRGPASGNPDPRFQARLWDAAGVDPFYGAPSGAVVSTPQRERFTPACDWEVTEDVNGFDEGRRRLRDDFEGLYPTNSVNWGNTATIELCGGGQIASNGTVVDIWPRDDFGYSDTWPDFGARLGFRADEAKAGRSTIARLEVDWQEVGGGALCVPANWTKPDAAVAALRARDTKPLIVIDGACGGYIDSNCQGGNVRLPQDNALALAAWRDFAASVASRYPDSVGIEVWNEPNARDFWGGCAPDPARYARLLKAASDGIGSGVPIVVAGPQPTPDNPNVSEWRAYLRAVFTAWAQQYPGQPLTATVDAIGLHPYAVGGIFRGSGPDEWDKIADSASRQLNNPREGIRDAVLEPTGIALPVWVTEVGVSTNGNLRSSVKNRDAQARALELTYRTLRVQGVPVTAIHRLVDDHSLGSTHWEAGVGVLTQTPEQRKCAWNALGRERGDPSSPSECPGSP